MPRSFEIHPRSEAPPIFTSKWQELTEPLRKLQADEALLVLLEPGETVQNLRRGLGIFAKRLGCETRRDSQDRGIWILKRHPLDATRSHGGARPARAAPAAS